MNNKTLDSAWDDPDEFDFGFTSMSESELKSTEVELVATVERVKLQSAELKTTVVSYEEKLKKMHKLIMPLLKNLSNDDGKEYIYWPDRKKKVEEFIKKIDNIMK
jgi:hypothetical protein